MSASKISVVVVSGSLERMQMAAMVASVRGGERAGSDRFPVDECVAVFCQRQYLESAP